MLEQLYNHLAARVRNLGFIKRHPALKELIKYSLVGNANNLIDLGLYIYLTRAYEYWHAHYILANIVTMFIASVSRFVFNKIWTFRDRNRDVEVQFIKFTLTLFIGLIANIIIIILAVEYLHIHDILAKLIGMGLASLIVFSLSRHWVFNKKNNIQP